MARLEVSKARDAALLERDFWGADEIDDLIRVEN